MANITINGLTALTSEPLDGSFVPIWESGATKKVSIANLLGGYLPLSGGTLTGDLTVGSSSGVGISNAGGAGKGRLLLSGTQRVEFSSTQLAVGSGCVVGFSSTSYADAGSIDTGLRRSAAGILSQRNGANAQEQQIYGTYTDASNYERLALRTAAGDYTIATEAAGTGTQRNLVLSGANRAAHIADVSSGTDTAYEDAINAIIAALESHGLAATS